MPEPRYHSITCENPCPGWGCECWCHPCQPLPDTDHSPTCWPGRPDPQCVCQQDQLIEEDDQ